MQLHHKYAKLIEELKINKTKEMMQYQDFESQKLVQEKNFIEEEKERLKINKIHLDLDVKVNDCSYKQIYIICEIIAS